MGKTTTVAADRPPISHGTVRRSADLFLISALVLFFELACIRFLPARVLFLTFFTNTVLLACFLGMSLGCLAAWHRRNYLQLTPVVLVVALAAAWGVEALRDQLEKIVDVGNQASPQLIYFGTEYHAANVERFVVPIELVEAVFFLLIAIAMVGPGQQLGRSLAQLPNRVLAYTVNIAGSIAGIVLFSLLAWLRFSPPWWFSLVALGVAYFLLRPPFTNWHVVGIAALALAVLMTSSGGPLASRDREQFWSPYYRIDYAAADKEIRVNLIGHQQMISRDAVYPAYALPFLLNRDSGGQPFHKVLVIGAGTGNDVSRALQWGATHVDAVEIDPVIKELGTRFHPDRPYDESKRVFIHQADGRNFLRSTDEQYDLIVYALVDSLVLHSSYSNIRLESFLFTKEAFADVRRRLKPDGLFVMYNYFRQGWLVARLEKTLAETFDAQPLVFTLPYQAEVTPESADSGITFFVAGEKQALEELQKRFTSPDGIAPALYWVDRNRAPGPDSPDGFAVRPTLKNWNQYIPFGLAKVVEPADLPLPTDDWPFLYLRRPMIPSLSLRGAAIMGGMALLLLVWFAPPRQEARKLKWRDEANTVLDYWRRRPQATGAGGQWAFDGRMFFLGAGFMLIETTAVVHMALVFGGTWIVNSLVFLAVLVMILLANWFVLAWKPTRLSPYYALLFVALGLNIAVPLNLFLAAPKAVQILGACSLVFAPVLFAAIVFAVSFAKTAQAERAFGFNIAGAMAGGLSEYASMLLGFRLLLLAAVAYYLLSAFWKSNEDPKLARLSNS